MRCLETEDCWCANCTDAAIDRETGADIRPIAVKTPSARTVSGPVDIAWIFENGLEQKLSVSVRCF